MRSDGTAFVSEAFASKAFGTEVVALATPVKAASGDVIGAITGVFDVRSMLNQLVADSRFNQSGFAVIVDGNGDIIAHPDFSRLGTSVRDYEAVRLAWATGGAGSIVARNADGMDRLFFYRAITNPATATGRQPWVLLTEIDEAEELTGTPAPASANCWQASPYLFVISLLLAQQIATSVDRPLTSLKHLAARLARAISRREAT